MAKQNSRPNHSRAGVKTLIAVASIGCTLGGWMYFSNTALDQTSNTASVAQASTQVVAAQPAALPTLVPINDAIAASNAVASQTSSQQTTSQVLRSVTVPQASVVAMSRSSQ